MNKEIEELYELIDNYRTPTEAADHTPAEPADGEASDSQSADHAPAEPDDGERVDNEQNNWTTTPLTTVLGPRCETTIHNSPDRAQRAPTPPRAPP